MSALILSLSDPSATLETVGGKGLSLARLARSGLPVPAGFHITTGAYQRFVADNGLQPRMIAELRGVDLSEPAACESASRQITAAFARGHIPPDIAAAIREAYQSRFAAGAPVAVRSSATAEDLPGASFAGQQETYLNLRGAADVLAGVQKCWASLWTPRAIAYRARQKIDPESVSLAVVVQALVPAQSAGVLFTANPVNGRRDEMLITAAWGLGEAIVAGAVTPDTLTVDKNRGTITRRETADKRVMTVRAESGVQEIPVPAAQQNAAVLSDEQAAALAKLGAEIEALYAAPMDIEWAWQDQFHILQARPITALPLEWHAPSPAGIYMRASIADLMPRPLSPLFASWAIPTLRAQMKPLAKRLRMGNPRLTDDYYTTINRYAYMNARMPPKTWWWILTGMLPAYPRLLRQLVTLWRDQLHPEYRAFVQPYLGKIPAAMSAGELLQDAQSLLEAASTYACGLLFATMGASAGSEGLLTRLYDRLARREGDPDAACLLMGWENIPLQAEKSLFDLAAWVKAQPPLAETIRATPAVALARHLAGQSAPAAADETVWGQFRQRFAEHLRQFGHIVYQLDFAEPLPLDTPIPMLENVKMYLRNEGADPYQRQQASAGLRVQTAENARRQLKGVKRWAFEKALRWAQSLAEVREDALAEIGLAYPMLRAFLGELGRRLAGAGALAQAEEIYWLEIEEVRQCVVALDLGQTPPNFAAQIAERKAFDEKARQETPPPMIPMMKKYMGFNTTIWLAETESNRAGATLKGVATSAGKVTAPACVLRSVEDFSKMRRGDVLVAGATTPAWTPLFALAAAVVTDIGGPLSHGSIVAREYGIPAVMGVGVATRRIQDGQVITVDGSAGVVTLEPA